MKRFPQGAWIFLLASSLPAQEGPILPPPPLVLAPPALPAPPTVARPPMLNLPEAPVLKLPREWRESPVPEDTPAARSGESHTGIGIPFHHPHAAPPWTPEWLLPKSGLGAGASCFNSLPCVRPLKPCDGANLEKGNCDGGKCLGAGDGKTTDECDKCAWTAYRFDAPAHFPHPRFAEDGHPVTEEGVVIYEGMVFRFEPNSGRYQVLFTAHVPDMPVTLRLQFGFDVGGRIQTITLPPIVFPEREESVERSLFGERRRTWGNWQGRVWEVSHEGTSAWIRETAMSARFDGIRIQRIGTARFGSLPQ